MYVTLIIQTQENIKATSSLQLPLDYDQDTSFSLTVEGEDLDREVTIFTERTNNFRFESKALSIFIQTDKAIYQPGELSNYNTFYFDIECNVILIVSQYFACKITCLCL